LLPHKTLINAAFITIIFSVSNVLAQHQQWWRTKEDRLYVNILQTNAVNRTFIPISLLLNEEIKELKKGKTVTNKN